MFHEILKFIYNSQEEITFAWAREIVTTLPSYRLLQNEEIRKNTRLHLEALLLCIEKKDDSKLKTFLKKIAPDRRRLNFKLSETQHAFMIGKSLLWNKILQKFEADLNGVLPFLKLIDDCFCRSLFYYSEIYQKIQVQEIEKRSKALVKAEEEKKYLERLKIEYKKLDEIVSAIGANLVLVDRNGKVIWTNRLIRDRVGKNVVGKNCHEIYIGEFSPCRNCIVEEVFRTKQQHHHLRRTQDKQGNPRYFQIVSTPILDEHENVREVLELMQDVTERKTLEARLLQSERLATIGKMAARVAHEIRNPLSSISLNVELLEEEIQSFRKDAADESLSLLKAISEEVDRLAQITEEYLQFSRFPQSQFLPGNINEVIEDLLDFMEFEFSKKNISVESNLDPKIPDSWLDRAQMRQALLNIVRNAIESMKDNGKLIIRTSLDDDEIIRIQIRDTGEGISPENLEKIFDPFYTTKDVGTGLGLPMSQQIVTEHRGEIVCESERGVGTTFTILVPQYPGKGEIIRE